MRASLGLLAVAMVSVGTLAIAACGGSRAAGAEGDTALGVSDYRVSAPVTHDNLTVYLIHGKDTLTGKSYLTLTEAMEQKKVIVHETKNVNNLQIENLSDDEVYVQSGDIVKGGQQDRTFANDCIIPAKSGKLDMAAFCVEQGRWSARGGEAKGSFSGNHAMVSGKEMKNAIQRSNSQHDVWAGVSENQKKLSDNIKTSAASTQSATSLQLTLEKKEVVDSTAAYLAALEPIIKERADVIGYVAVVNGKVTSVDVYGSHALFAKLWPKLVRSSSVEALAEKQAGKTFAAAGVGDIKTFMLDAQKGKRLAEKEVGNGRAKIQQRDGTAASISELKDLKLDAPAHSGYVAH